MTRRRDPATLAALTADPANRRKHDQRNLDAIAASLKDVGAARSIVIDEDDVILAGNGVTQAARAAGLTKLRIIEAAGDEIIAVRRRGLTDAQKRALAIGDNRTAELATWNVEQLLADQAAGLALGAWWTDEELAALLTPNGDIKEGKTDPDAVPAVRATDIQRGDLFALGAHRLLCGDSTDAADVARVMGSEKPFLMVTDPPYGVDYDPQWRQDAADKGHLGFGATRLGIVTNDHRSDWTDAWRLFPGDVAYIWHAVIHPADTPAVAMQLFAASFIVRSQIIWRKRSFAISRGHYHWQHEPCWYAVRKGKRSRWCGDHSQSTVWEVALDRWAAFTGQTPKKVGEAVRTVSGKSVTPASVTHGRHKTTAAAAKTAAAAAQAQTPQPAPARRRREKAAAR